MDLLQGLSIPIAIYDRIHEDIDKYECVVLKTSVYLQADCAFTMYMYMCIPSRAMLKALIIHIHGILWAIFISCEFFMSCVHSNICYVTRTGNE